MYLHINDRSDLNEVVAIGRDETGKYTVKKTRLQELRNGGYPRTDVVLMNATNSGREYTLHVSKDGFIGDLFLLDVISEEQHFKLMAIANRMRKNAEDFVAARKLVAGW